MSETPVIESVNASDDAQLEYRALEPWAVVALVLGLTSPVALAAPVLWLVPILGLLASATALRNIRRESLRTGRGIALAGLALSTFCIVLPIARMTSASVLIARQPRPVADQFLEYLREGSPEKALLLHIEPDFRPPADEGLWLLYRGDARTGEELHKFVSHPAIRMILNLGEKADIRFFKTAASGSTTKAAVVHYWYTITFTDDDGRKKTAVYSVLLERKPTANPELNPWQVMRFGVVSGPGI